ncbi:hypothetical protein V6N13_098029 [Hibiscus sabdariffa]
MFLELPRTKTRVNGICSSLRVHIIRIDLLLSSFHAKPRPHLLLQALVLVAVVAVQRLQLLDHRLALFQETGPRVLCYPEEIGSRYFEPTWSNIGHVDSTRARQSVVKPILVTTIILSSPQLYHNQSMKLRNLTDI